jgi:hypothetical protein
VSLQGRLAHFGAPGARRGYSKFSSRPPTAAGVWYKHLDGGFPVQGVRFGGLKSVKFGLAWRLALGTAAHCALRTGGAGAGAGCGCCGLWAVGCGLRWRQYAVAVARGGYTTLSTTGSRSRHCFTYIGSPNGPIQRPNPVRYVQYEYCEATARSETRELARVRPARCPAWGIWPLKW